MNTQESEGGTFEDFTLASPWEKLLDGFERALKTFQARPAESGGCSEMELHYGSQRLALVYHRLGSDVAEPGSACVLWALQQHPLQLRFGVSEFLTIGPAGGKADPGLASLLLSTAAVALANTGSDLPVFVEPSDGPSNGHRGVAVRATAGLVQYLDTEHVVYKSPTPHPELASLVELLRGRTRLLGILLDPSDLQVSMRQTFETPGLAPVDSTGRFDAAADDRYWDDDMPWSAWHNLDDPILGFRLQASWPLMSADGAKDVRSIEVKSAGSAAEWRLEAVFDNSHGGAVTCDGEVSGFATLLRGLSIAYLCAVGTKFMDDFAHTNLTERNEMWALRRAFNVPGSLLKVPPPTAIVRNVQMLFDEDSPSTAPPPATPRAAHPPCKAALPGSLFARFCMQALRSPRIQAVAALWTQFVQEVRWFWEEAEPLPHVAASGPPDLGTCLVHQKLQMLAACIRRRAADPEFRRKSLRSARAHLDALEDERTAEELDTTPSAPPAPVGDDWNSAPGWEDADFDDASDADVSTFHPDVSAPKDDVSTSVDAVRTYVGDVRTPLKNASTPPTDVSTPLKDASTLPADVTIRLDDVRSLPADVSASCTDTNAPPTDVSTSLTDVTTPPANASTPIENVTTPLSSAPKPSINSSAAGTEKPGSSDGHDSTKVRTPGTDDETASEAGSAATHYDSCSDTEGFDSGGWDSPKVSPLGGRPDRAPSPGSLRNARGKRKLEQGLDLTKRTEFGGVGMSGQSGGGSDLEGREGSLGPVKELWLLKVRRRMHEPITQEPPYMTEDMLREQETALAALNSFDQGKDALARLHSRMLSSDMSAFKAANPGAVLEDFVRWHSPRDWLPEDGLAPPLPTSTVQPAPETPESPGGPAPSTNVPVSESPLEDVPGSATAQEQAPAPQGPPGRQSSLDKVPGWPPRGNLSRRMQADSFWGELWDRAECLPVTDQRPLFDHTREAEKVLHYLDMVEPQDLLPQMLATAFAAAHDLLTATFSDTRAAKRSPQKGRSEKIAAPRLSEKRRAVASEMSRTLELGHLQQQTKDDLGGIQAALERLCYGFEDLEALALKAASLGEKLPGRPELATKLMPAAGTPETLGTSSTAVINLAEHDEGARGALTAGIPVLFSSRGGGREKRPVEEPTGNPTSVVSIGRRPSVIEYVLVQGVDRGKKENDVSVSNLTNRLYVESTPTGVSAAGSLWKPPWPCV